MARPRSFDESDVLSAARQTFNETGFHGTSVDDLSQVTGLSKGSLYGAFGDKATLFRRVLDDYCSQALVGADDRLQGRDDQALDRLRAWLRAPDGDIDRRGCLLAKATAELAWEDEEVAARSNATHRGLIDGTRALIEQAQRAGHVDPGADSEALGAFMVATHRGLEALAKAGTDVGTLQTIADTAVASISTIDAPAAG